MNPLFHLAALVVFVCTTQSPAAGQATHRAWATAESDHAFIRIKDGVWNEYSLEERVEKLLFAYEELAVNPASVVLYDKSRHMLVILTANAAYLASPQDTNGVPRLQWEGGWTGSTPQLIWETAGGGQIKFTAVKDGDAYVIHVTEHSFQDVNLRFRLTSKDQLPYRLMGEILSQKRAIPNDPAMKNRATGTWTTITVVNSNGESKKVPYAKPWHDDLHPISDFVNNAIREAVEQ